MPAAIYSSIYPTKKKICQQTKTKTKTNMTNQTESFSTATATASKIDIVQEFRDIHVIMRLILSINLLSFISTTFGIFAFLKLIYTAVFVTLLSLVGALIVILYDGPFKAFVVTHFETSEFNSYFSFVENHIEKAANYAYGYATAVAVAKTVSEPMMDTVKEQDPEPDKKVTPNETTENDATE